MLTKRPTELFKPPEGSVSVNYHNPRKQTSLVTEQNLPSANLGGRASMRKSFYLSSVQRFRISLWLGVEDYRPTSSAKGCIGKEAPPALGRASLVLFSEQYLFISVAAAVETLLFQPVR